MINHKLTKMAQDKESNTFAQMEQDKVNNPENSVKDQKPIEKVQSNSNELSLDDFSNTAVGDKVSYVRPNLDKTQDVVEQFQVFMPDIVKDEPRLSKDKKTEYWPVTMILTYASKNEDGANNREYISGTKVFEQRTGGPSEPSIWYDTARTQAAYLWEKVAEAKGVGPEDLSPREFIAFLNNKPKVDIISKEYDNFAAAKGAPKFVYKNMPGKFL